MPFFYTEEETVANLGVAIAGAGGGGGGGAVSSVNGQTGNVIITKTDVGLSNVNNTSDLNKPVSTATQTALDLKEDKSSKGVANGYAELDSSGKVPSSQLPNIASSISTLTDVSLNSLNNNNVLVYNNATSKWENKTIQDVAGGEVVPIGSIQAFYSNTIPAGYLLCNGSTFNAVDYPDLNTFLGSNTLPDLRGYFLRGLGGVDPEVNTRTLGSIQQDELKSHSHPLPTDQSSTDDIPTVMNSGGSDEGISPANQTGLTGGLETRPKNIAVNFIIKAKHNPASAYNLIAGSNITIVKDEVGKIATISNTGYTNLEIDTALELKADKSTTYTKTEVDIFISKKQTIVGDYAEFTINENSSVVKNDILALTKVDSSSNITLDADGKTIILPANKTFEIYTNLNTGSYISNQEAKLVYKKPNDLTANLESFDLSESLPNASKTNLYTTDPATSTLEDFTTKIKLQLDASKVSGWKQTLLNKANIDYVGISAVEIAGDTICVVDYTDKFSTKVYIYKIENLQFVEKQVISRSGGLTCCLSGDADKIFIGNRYGNKLYVYEKDTNGFYVENTSKEITGVGSLGQSIACTNDGLTIVASAHSANSVFVYKYDNTAQKYVEYFKITLPDASLLGYGLSCSTDGERLALSDNNGFLRILKHTPSVETKYQELFKAPYKAYDVSFNATGNLVAFSVTNTVVGNVPGNQVLIYKKGASDNQWVKIREFSKPNETHNGFGYSIDLSLDGSTLAAATKNLVQGNTFKAGIMTIYKTTDNWTSFSEETIAPSSDVIPINGVVGFSCAISGDGSFIVDGGNWVRGYQAQASIDNLDISILAGSKILIKETAKDDKVSNTKLTDTLENYHTKTQADDLYKERSNLYYNSENVKTLYQNSENPYQACLVSLDPITNKPLVDANGFFVLDPPLPYTEIYIRPFIVRQEISLKGATNLTGEFIVYLPNPLDVNAKFYDEEQELSVLELAKKSNLYETLDPIKYPTDADKLNWYFDKDVYTFTIKAGGFKNVIFKVAEINNQPTVFSLKGKEVIVTPPTGDASSDVEIKFRWDARTQMWIS